jgi:histidinol dehydrogenase
MLSWLNNVDSFTLAHARSYEFAFSVISGIYVPGGTAPLISTVLMLGVPAQMAECPLRILSTPPNQDGSISPSILFAAKLCGIQNVFKVGGAQAIAAMAYGTQTIPKVDKIFGPGNSWVTQAKMQVSQDAFGSAIDMPAGPSEVMIIADDESNCDYVAADLLSQAEHGPDSQVLLITLSESFAIKTRQALIRQLAMLPRMQIAKQALENSSMIIVSTLEEAIEISNAYAPEHLILQIRNAKKYIPIIKNAGSVFIGPWTPETLGDYVTGANHVLPTNGYARSYSGLSVLDFMKFISFQTVTQQGLANIGPYAEKLAALEGLSAHKNAVSLRLKENEIESKEMPTCERLIRSDLREFNPYSSARDEGKKGKIWLNANESPFNIQYDNNSYINRYPQKQPDELIKIIADIYGVPDTRIALTRGSDEGIDLLIRLFCRAGHDSITLCPPTFGREHYQFLACHPRAKLSKNFLH